MPSPRQPLSRLSLLMGAALLLAACTQGGAPSSSAAGSPASQGASPSAPTGREVDTEPPVFSNPTDITNPLFPISDLAQVVQLGEEAGDTLRVEITLLPETRAVEIDGNQVEAVVSQYVAYGGGRIVEVALDFYAQADDGSVWYLGEEVDNYGDDGKIADNEGTWLAGTDGPPGMIMPANPQVGDVYHPENIPDLVYETVTVLEADLTVDGPRGSVDGAIRTEEVLMDGAIEHKTMAPGYGEFAAEAEDEQVTVAIAVPIDEGTDAAVSDAALELTELSRDLFDHPDDLDAATAVTDAAGALAELDVPPLLADELSAASAAVTDAGDTAELQAAAVQALQAALDVQLLDSEVRDVDLGRIDAWARQAIVDATAEDGAGLLSDASTLETIGARSEVGSAASAAIEALRASAESGDFRAAADAVTALLEG
jgi:hypothetical protein